MSVLRPHLLPLHSLISSRRSTRTTAVLNTPHLDPSVEQKKRSTPMKYLESSLSSWSREPDGDIIPGDSRPRTDGNLVTTPVVYHTFCLRKHGSFRWSYIPSTTGGKTVSSRVPFVSGESVVSSVTGQTQD